MADSLLLNGQIELMQFGSPSTLPQCPGAMFRLGQGYDLGAPLPVTNIVVSLLLDGERPMGSRFSNRTFTIPVTIVGTSRFNLAAAKETLLQLVNSDTWVMTWCRDSGLNLNYQCFRGSAYVITDNIMADRAFIATVTLTIPAAPFGASDTYQILPFAGAVVPGVPVPPSPVTLDGYTTVSGSYWTQQTTGSAVGGTDVAHWTNPENGISCVYTSTFSAKNLTGLTTLSHYIGSGTTQYYWGSTGWWTNFSIGYVLKDSAGHTLAFGVPGTVFIPQSYGVTYPNWDLVTVQIPQGVSGFLYNSVTSYTVTITNYGGYALYYTDIFLDQLIASPGTVTSTPVVGERGAVYNLAGIIGTSHAPLNIQAQSAAGSAAPMPTLILHRPGIDAPTNLAPMVVVNNSAGGSAYNDVPNGSILYPVPPSPLLPGQNAGFDGTYSVVLGVKSWDGGNTSGVARTITVAVTQLEYAGQTTITANQVQSVTQSVIPAQQVGTGMLIALGELTLPNRDISPQNNQAQFWVSVYSSDPNDRFYDCLLLDTMGETLILNMSTTGYVSYWALEPTIDKGQGQLLGSNSDITRAVSVLDSALVSGGPLTVDPGSNVLLAYSLQDAPGLVASYLPRWWRERLQ